MSDTAKKGILVVSFGTSHEDTRAVTIDAIEKEIGACVFCAFVIAQTALHFISA